MKIFMTFYTTIITIILALNLVSCAHTNKNQVQGPPVPEQLNDTVSRALVEDLLVQKGLDREKIHSMIYDPRIVIDPQFILRSLFNTTLGVTTSKSDYMYYNPRFIPKGRAFIEENRVLFDHIKEHYDISPEIITAILIIESKLGTYAGEYYAFQVYTNLALANDPYVLSLLKVSQGAKYPGLYDVELIKKAQARGKWALDELYDLILLADKLHYDPLALKSSNAGALGPAQFIPSTFMGFGVAGDSDGRIDPFYMPDAIASIANYLKESGWTDTGSEDKRRTAIWIYNHSEIYVNTILKIYRELEIAGPTPSGS